MIKYLITHKIKNLEVIMKKFLSLFAVIFLAFSSVACAQMGASKSNSQAMGSGYGMGMMHGMNMSCEAPVVLNANDAAEAVSDHLDLFYTDYVITDAFTFMMKNGSMMYGVAVQDMSGNKFMFYVSPCGTWVGPITMMHMEMGS